ncbi:PfkB family carbohydrate kinase [Streptomyces sp. NBC_00878]|uniref:carbohydrate kinase family protein n=1 Tax=Streptomyces sp. NBC_00878 TaxID=2975854 RepID=UPI00338D890A
MFCGDIAFDVALRVPHLPDPDQKTHAFENLVSAGGVAANSAVACARQGVTTALLAVVGDDVLGACTKDFLASRGVDVTAVTTTPGITGHLGAQGGTRTGRRRTNSSRKADPGSRTRRGTRPRRMGHAGLLAWVKVGGSVRGGCR